MGYIITKPRKSCWIENKFYWPGRVEFLSNKKCVSLFLSEKTHNCKVDYVKDLVEEFPKLFINVDFYTEENIKKVMLDISPEYNIEL